MSPTSQAPAEQPIRLALVGCGAITVSMHLPAIRGTEGVRVTAFCDPREEHAVQARQQVGDESAAIVTDPAKLAGLADAAIVAVPSRLHAPISIGLLESGLDVLCEKPIAATVAEAHRMVEAARTRSRLLACGLVSRFNKNNELFRQMLVENVMGEIREVIVEAGTVLDWDMTTDSYFNKKTTGGGVLFDFGIHAVDRAVWLLGVPEDIEYEDDSFGGVEANARIRAAYVVNGRRVPVTMTFSWTHNLPGRIEVVGSEASIEVPLSEPNTVTLTRTIGGKPVRFTTRLAKASPNPFLLQMQDFTDAVRRRRQPFITGASAAESLAVVERAYAVRGPMAMSWVEANGSIA